MKNLWVRGGSLRRGLMTPLGSSPPSPSRPNEDAAASAVALDSAVADLALLTEAIDKLLRAAPEDREAPQAARALEEELRAALSGSERVWQLYLRRHCDIERSRQRSKHIHSRCEIKRWTLENDEMRLLRPCSRTVTLNHGTTFTLGQRNSSGLKMSPRPQAALRRARLGLAVRPDSVRGQASRQRAPLPLRRSPNERERLLHVEGTKSSFAAHTTSPPS